MRIIRLNAIWLAGLMALCCTTAVAGNLWLDELDFSKAIGVLGSKSGASSTNEEKFPRSVQVVDDSVIALELDGKVKEFVATAHLPKRDNQTTATSEFVVFGDGRELWRSGVLRPGDAAIACRVKLRGVKRLELILDAVEERKATNTACWVDAKFDFGGSASRVMAAKPETEPFDLLTPPAPAKPRVNGPPIYGVRPGSPFLYRIPTTGERPMSFSAVGLPDGLLLDANSGIITGTITKPGAFDVKLVARNSKGRASRSLRIVVGSRLALTPPMGWNSWYIHYDRVSEPLMREAAEQMIATGMADYGYQYVNIDDCWMKKKGDEPYRDAGWAVLPNQKFPDMKSLADFIHGQGLKAGLYTSPGPWTCGGYVGAYDHEAADARKFAEWGFDFLKYDWCSYGHLAKGGDPKATNIANYSAGASSLAAYQAPYQLMHDEIQKLDRDIVLNLCQYGMGEVWKWGGEVGHSWRTTGDLGLAAGARLPGFYGIAFSNAKHWEFARPGAWNDPDYILIGWVGDARGMGVGKKTTLTANEQYSYMSLWSLMAAPLFFSGDMAKLDPFTVNVLCNHEVIGVNQDILGKQARIVRQNHRELVLAKPLEDGSVAVGLFNLTQHAAKLSVEWADLGLKKTAAVRDVWRQKDLGKFSKRFEPEIPRHGVSFVVVSRKD